MSKHVFLCFYIAAYFCVRLVENCTEKGVIAITFDDGPTQGTKDILEIAKNNVPLTFHFTVHQSVRGNLDNIYEHCADDGHTVGFKSKPKKGV